MKDLNVTVVQVSAGPDMEANLSRLSARVRSAPAGDLLALPEVFAVRGDDDDYRGSAEPVSGRVVQFAASLAASRKEWVLAGSVCERAGGRVFNTSVLLDRKGRVAATYRKMHLFEARLDTGQVVKEETIFVAGKAPVMVDIEGWKCGMAICYDVRFPELFRHYADGGAHLFFLPSNFTQRTGKDHWEVLVRARAIENQAFVIAPAQCGMNMRTNIESHGHSMIVDPWGDVLARAAKSEEVITARLEVGRLKAIRSRIPVLDHRRIGRTDVALPA